MELPVSKYLNPTDARAYGIADATRIEEWVRAEYDRIDAELAGSNLAYGASDPQHGRVTAAIQLRDNIGRLPEGNVAELDALQARLYAAGWNTVEYSHGPRIVTVLLSAFLTPVIVVTEREEFAPTALADEDPEATAMRIGTQGTWRYLNDGTREFVPPHQILHVRISGWLRKRSL